MRNLTVGLTLALGLTLVATSGCRKRSENYPVCEKNRDCDKGEPCVDGVCQNCQTDDDCKGKGPNGEDLPCTNHRCEEPVTEGGVCTSEADCDPGMICLDGACSFCTEDSQCDSGKCILESGRCEVAPCTTDDDCPVDEICDGGQCIYHPLDGGGDEAICGITALYFGFDSAKLSPGNQEELKVAADCLIELLVDGKTLAIEAHADNIGTEEYNILLTDRRGTSVLDFLANMGVERDVMRVVGKGALEATGSTEQERAQDRRVQFIIE